MALLIVLCGLVAVVACVPPKVCNISPIEIEEFKSDTRDLDVELARVQDILVQREAELATVEDKVAARKAEIPGLHEELRRAKRASGVTQKPAEELGQATEQAQQ
jgi:hypothetical protein